MGQPVKAQEILAALQKRWQTCQLIHTQLKDGGWVDVLVERDDGSLLIAGSKSGVRVNREWELQSTSPEAVKKILQALRLNRPISFVAATSGKTSRNGANAVIAKTESKLKWQQIFPDDELPEAYRWTIDKQAAKKRGDYLVVTHTLKCGRARQINEYQLPLEIISMAVYESTLLYKTFPFNIPHSHKVTEGKEVTYDRGIDQWEEHSAQKGLLEESNVRTKSCVACKTDFYDTSTQDYCYTCMIGRQSDAEKEAVKLCKLAEKHAKSSDWKETGDKLKALQQEWQQLKNIPREKNEKLWARFNKANQGFFDRRSKFFDKMDQQRAGNLKKAKQLIKAAEKAVANKNKHDAREDVKALQQQWKAVNPLPREHSDALWNEFRDVCQTVFTKA